MIFSSMHLASSRSRLKSPNAKLPIHHIHHEASSLLHPAHPHGLHILIPLPLPSPHLLLRPKPRRPNIRPPQLNTQHLLHRSQNLLIRRRAPPLEISNDRGGGVALCCEVFLRHLGLHFLALVRDHLADFFADCVGLDDFVGAVDFGEALAFATAGLGECQLLHLMSSSVVGECELGRGPRWWRCRRGGVVSECASEVQVTICHIKGSRLLTALPEAYFFSVPSTAPLRCAWFSAALPRMTVSRCAPPAPRVLLPIFVTVSQSSIVAVCICIQKR